MMQIRIVVMLCGLMACWPERTVTAESSATRPATDGPRRGMAHTRPADGRAMDSGDRAKEGGRRNRLDNGDWRPLDGLRPGLKPDSPRPGIRHGGPEGGTLTPQEKEDLLAFAREHFPEMYKRLERFRQKDPATYGGAMRRLAGPMLRMMRLSKSNPELADALIVEHKVEMELADMQAGYATISTEADREQKRGKIRELVEKRFDVRQRRLDLEIREMQQRLDEAMARLSQQASNRSQLVEAEVSRMINRLESGPRGRHRQPTGGDNATHAFPTDPPAASDQQ